MTKDEAKTKWCPQTGPRFDKALHPNQCCLGAVCMAWRWSRAKETKAYLDAVHARVKETGENFNVATNKVWARLASTFEQTEGYCGLAGKPE